ncbi:MAG TPA: hypothetical protein VEX60_11730 [Pyrinomonadaceae bacterium]|nr:hypothetical protein [Pyrinomonadaceae bacterium]
MSLMLLFGNAAFYPAAGQKPKEALAQDSARLRQAFTEACGTDFEIVKDDLGQRSVWHGAGTFWLVHVKPKRTGHYSLKYRYDYNDPHYTHVEHELYMNVGEKGCRRMVRSGAIASACMGDTIIFPVVLGKFTGHTFNLRRQENSPPSEEVQKSLRDIEVSGLYTEPVANPAGEHLKYVGRRVNYMPHRNGGFTAEFYATFEAVKPGSFNLTLAGRAPDSTIPKLTASGSVPVVILEKDAPATVLAQYETVVGTDAKRGFSSHSGNEYLMGIKILQTGDRIALPYQSFSSRRTAPKEEIGLGQMTKDAVPVIERFPFQADPQDRYNEWIIEHLKVANSWRKP